MKESPATLRELWRSHITIGDYERHMANVGQAQANASLLEELFRHHAPKLGSRILFAGAGTGQCFDYFPANLLGRYRTTFADLNPEYLARLSERLRGGEIATVVDDIEDSRLAGPFDLAVVVLVLEHVNWRRAVASLARQASRVFAVIQQNPANPPPLRLEGSLAALGDVPPTLVDAEALRTAMRDASFELAWSAEREVLDGKRMLALDFIRAPRTSAS